MATVSNNNPTLMDWKQALDPQGNVAILIDLLEQTNEILQDLSMIEGNELTGHLMNVATGLPPVVWRRLYERINPGKGRRVQVRESAGWMEAYHEIDSKLVSMAGNGQAFRMQEAQLQLEAMSQELAKKLFYGNPDTDPKDIMGLAARYSSRSNNVENSRNVIDASGTGSDNRSIWLVNWGPMGFFTFTPKGMPAGLQMEDKGRVTSETSDGLMEVHRMRFEWTLGCGLADWRYCGRICNIDFSNLTDDAASGANLPVLMADLIRKVPRRQMMRPAFYLSQDVWGYIEKQLSAATKESTLTQEDVGGRLITRFKGIPMRQVDQLEVDEARVT